MSRLAGGGHAPSPVWAVIRREFIQRVRSRWFLFATLGVPLLIVGGAVVPIWLTSQSEAAARTVVLIDRSGELDRGELRKVLEWLGFRMQTQQFEKLCKMP